MENEFVENTCKTCTHSSVGMPDSDRRSCESCVRGIEVDRDEKDDMWESSDWFVEIQKKNEALGRCKEILKNIDAIGEESVAFDMVEEMMRIINKAI